MNRMLSPVSVYTNIVMVDFIVAVLGVNRHCICCVRVIFLHGHVKGITSRTKQLLIIFKHVPKIYPFNLNPQFSSDSTCNCQTCHVMPLRAICTVKFKVQPKIGC